MYDAIGNNLFILTPILHCDSILNYYYHQVKKF